MRSEQNPILQTGHLHLPLIQASQSSINYYIYEGYRNADLITINHSPYMKELINKIKIIIDNIK